MRLRYEITLSDTISGNDTIGIGCAADRGGGAKSKEELLRQVAFHVIVGNADAHGKNFSFLHNNDRTVRLAPAYDVMSTSYYSIAYGRQISSELGLFVNHKRDIDEVTVEDLLAEAECWGVRRERGKAVLNELLERIPEALSHVIAQVPNTPQALVELGGWCFSPRPWAKCQ